MPCSLLQLCQKIINRPIFICSVKDVTQNNILAALELETESKFIVENVDIKKIIQDATEALRKGDSKAATKALTIKGQFDEEDSAADFWHLMDNDIVGVSPVSVREAVKTVLEAMGKT